MTPQDWLLVGVVGFVALQRLVELAVSRRHERRLLTQGAVRAPRDGFLPLVAVHAGLLVFLPLEWFVAPWPRTGPHTAPLLAVAAAAILLRYWAAASLGVHYTVRVLRLPATPLVRRGPYRWMRHPIYRAVALEVFALPLAFGALLAGAALGALNLWALQRRIGIEEAHLGVAPMGAPRPR